jgi:hypothetical protein
MNRSSGASGGFAIYQRWSIHGEIEQCGIFKVAQLAAAKDELPRRVKVKNQNAMLRGDA